MTNKKSTYNQTTNQPRNKAAKRSLILLAVLVLAVLALSACSSEIAPNQTPSNQALAGFPQSDMSGYAGLEGCEKELVFVDVTMEDVDALMKNGETFILYAGFANCPWCNSLISHLNDVALEQGEKIAYLDTRRDPSWQSNLDLEGYDTFVEYFGEYLEIDGDGKPHLYVPDVYFIKDGQVVDRHEGVVPGLGSPSDPITDELLETLTSTLEEKFGKLQ